jgi:glycine betaine/choline ABC-type transport system substrate-binding protein
MKARAMLRAACTGLAAVLLACTSSRGNVPSPAAEEAARHGAVITAGPFDFPERALLAEIYRQALPASTFPVQIPPDLSPHEPAGPALMSGLLQAVLEYAGSALDFISLSHRSPTARDTQVELAGIGLAW